MSDPIGQTLGSYALDSLIGGGPNGRVYRGRQVRLNRSAAVKVLAPRLTSTPDFSRRFNAAMQRVAGLRNPNIADIEDFGEQGGLAYIAMELYEQGSLRTFLQQRIRQRDSWDLAQVLDVVRQAADGLQAAHAAGFVHGHVKPENMLLQRRGPGTSESFRARVGDFGLLEIAGGLPVASLAYSTPEQTRGETPTPQSDIYALGVVLYEVSTGYVPFAVKTPEEAAEKHGRARPVPPTMVRQQLPAELEQIILRCLAKRPEQRYASAGELSEELGRIIRSNSPGQTVLLTSAPTQVIGQPPGQVTQALPIDPTQQPTVRMPADPSQQQTVLASSNVPRVELLDAQGNVLRGLDVASGGMTIGRTRDNALVLEHEQVSRQHARIDWNGRQATITDLGSANGTLLDGMRLPPQAPVPWGWNQRAQIGPFTLRLVAPVGMAAQAPTPAQSTDPLLQGLIGAGAATPTNAPTQTFNAPTQAYNVPAQAQAGARVGVLLDQEQITLTPGQREVLNLTLTNSGTASETVTVSVEGVPGMWVGVPQQGVQIPPGGRAPLALTISVPRDSESLAGDYPVIIRARSAMNPTDSTTARGRWSVLPFAASSLSITPRRANGRREASYQVTVRNDGNQTETFLIGADDDAQELRYGFSDESVTLDPGQATTVGMLVSAPGRLFGGANTFPFHVSAQAGDERPATATAQFVRDASISPAIPIVLFTLIAVALLFLWNNNRGSGIGAIGTATPGATATATATATAEPGAPVFSQFTLDPQVVQPNQPVTISWNVTGAESVELLVNGNVVASNLPPQGQQQYVVNQTSDITLRANGGGKQTVQTQQAVVATPVPPTAAPTTAATATAAAPTAIPPTAVPPSAVPPSAVPPTAVPPTAVPPTAVPPTGVPATAVPPPQPLNLISAARDATWSNNNAEDIEFGKPDENEASGGWAETQALAQLENGRPYFGPLYTVPLSGTGGFIAGTYDVPSIGSGQKFIAEVGFPVNTTDTTARIQVFYNGEVIFESEKQADGNILSINVDMTPFAGTGGTLAIRVENVSNPRNVGVYWIRPRIADR